MFTSTECVCSSCGKTHRGMSPGQPHRKCPGRSHQLKKIAPSEGGKNRTGTKLVTGRGTWEAMDVVMARELDANQA